MSRKTLLSLTVVLGASAAIGAFADTTAPKLATLDTLPEKYDQGNFDLSRDGKDMTFYQFMKQTLAKSMKMDKALPRGTNDDDLVKGGKGVKVQLNGTNYNVHVNYNSLPTSGRSYGWTKQGTEGLVGDWSDRIYLENLWTAVKGASDEDLKKFYSVITQLVGACDAAGLPGLSGISERVATNFLAIYGAEEYRATLGTRNWDDAIFDVSLLAAFHAGQEKFTLYYGQPSNSDFVSETMAQKPGDFDTREKPTVVGTKKAADMTDYWQFTSNAQKTSSGINETRIDFSMMGKQITGWEVSRKGEGKSMIDSIETIVKGSGDNVFEDVTQYFATGKARPADAKELGAKVADFEVQIRKDAKDITSDLGKAQDRAQDQKDQKGQSSDDQTSPTTPKRPVHVTPGHFGHGSATDELPA